MFKAENLKVIIFLIAIFTLALFLRLYRLGDFPIGFHIDEASLGYNAYSILKTGKDENGNFLPLYIDMFGDNRPSGYHHLAVLPVKLFGLTEFATRFPSAIFGAFSIFAIYIFSYQLFQDKKISLLSSLFIAIAPWHIVISRASGEAIISLFFILLGFALILNGLKQGKIFFNIVGGFMLIFSYFFYHTPRVFVPLFFFVLLISQKNIWMKNFSKFKSLYFTFMTISIVAVALVFFISGGTGRFTQVNIFGHPETSLVMNEQIREDGTDNNSVLKTRFFHNKVVNYSLTFISNYFEYFSGSFLFIKGGLPIWYQIPNMGLIYLVYLPFILIGIVGLFNSKSMYHKVPLIWLVVAPVTAAITVDDIPNINRVIVMFPVLEIITAYGIYRFISSISKSNKYPVGIVVTIIIILNFIYFQHQYYTHTKQHRTWFRNNGFKQMMDIVQKNINNFDKVVITKTTGGVYPLVLFYMNYDPVIYQNEKSPKGPDYGGFGKFYFVPQECPTKDKDDKFPKGDKIMYVNNGVCPDQKNIYFTDIYKEDGTKAFRIQL